MTVGQKATICANLQCRERRGSNRKVSIFYGLGFPSALSLNDFIVLGGGNRIKKMWLGSGVGRGSGDEGGVGIR